MNDHPPWDELDRYFAGDCTREEAEAIERWADAAPERASELVRARRVWELGAGARTVDVGAAWRAMQARMEEERRARRTGELRLVVDARPAGWRWWALGAAAAAAAVLVVGGGRWATTASANHARADQAEMREIRSGRGQRTEVLLTDGTRVLLNVDSRLRVPETYGTRAREVVLEGEALFDVRHDPQRPFRVRAGGALAEDLGTVFLVRAYPGDGGPTVVVETGEVRLRADSASTSDAPVLTRGQLGRVASDGGVVVERNVDLARHFAWTRGRIEIRKATLAQAARELERWYDVTIAIADSGLAAERLTASFERQPLDEVLEIIARSLGIQYRRDGTRVWFFVESTRR